MECDRGQSLFIKFLLGEKDEKIVLLTVWMFHQLTTKFSHSTELNQLRLALVLTE